MLSGSQKEQSLNGPAVMRNFMAGRVPRNGIIAILCYFAVRLIGLVVLAVWSSLNGKSATTLLSERWDSLWYVRVIERGYDFVLVAPDGRRLSDMAFFPLLPWLEKMLSWITGFSHPEAGLLVSAVASLVAASGIFAVVRIYHGESVAVLAVVLWAALPVGIVQSMAYSESLFMATASWSIYCALNQKWVPAGLLASAAGLTRPIGLAVTCAVLVAAVQAVKKNGASKSLMVGALISPVGAASYFLWVAAQKSSPFGYFEVQKEWGNGFDGGVAFAEFIVDLMFSRSFWGGIGLVAGIAILIWAYLLGFKNNYPLPLQVYSGIVIALALCSSGYFGSKPRLLSPAFTVLIPLAVQMLKLSSPLRYSVLGGLTLLSAVYGAFWLNGSGPP
ncbi:hypothetical protein ACIOWG_00195 [Streptomyces sp. NPDC087658]|uniref:hypothetical protein n=1 Tax=Streptomyces sp. NPDC087658 TaxID=3365800 RepID=UPI00380307BB